MRRKNSTNPLVNLLLALTALFFAGMFVYEHVYKFQPEEVLKGAVIKEKKMKAEVLEIVSPRGIKAYLLQEKSNPIISISFIFKNSGLAYAPENKQGLAQILSAALLEGAGNYSSAEFKELLEEKAVKLSFAADYDDFNGAMATTVESAGKAYEMLNAVLTKPRFDAKDLERVSAEALMVLKLQNEKPETVLNLELLKEMYKNHPYAWNPMGVEQNIKSVSKKDLLDYMNAHFAYDNLVVGIAGDIDADEAKIVLDKIFAGLKAESKIVELSKPEINFDGRMKDVKLEAAQAIALFAAEGVGRSDADFYPLYIANHIFGASGLNSKLMVKVREDKGLAYSVYSVMSLQDKSPLIKGKVSATPDKLPQAIRIFKEEWHEMGKKGVSKKELDDAKNYLLFSYNLRFASISGISEMLAYMQKENLGRDFLEKRNSYIEAVTLDEVNAAARKYFKDNGTLILVGKP